MMRARRGGACRSAAIFAAARSLAVAPALILLAGEAAWADCTPASASNVTATCSGTTLNQGGGPPGTSADPNGNGYGTGTETGIAITVESNASVTGTEGGIAIGAGSLTINAGATVSGPLAIWAATGSINITNSGSISVSVGGVSDAIYAYADATVTNNAGATITGGWSAINAGQFTNGSITLINSGSVLNTFSGYADLYAWNNVTVVNNAGANITGYGNAIWGHQGFVDVTNSGSISGTTPGNGLGSAILAGTYVAVTNNAGASITGAKYGIYAGGGSSTVFNAGTISGGTAAIRFAGTGNTLTLAPGSVITGNVLGTGSDTFQLGGTGAAAFDVSQLGPAAQYQGFGSFNKIGSSNWTLTGTSNYAGPVTVNGGTLNVDGDISSTSGVTVNAGAILGGTGIVSATAINGGALAPGSSTALLTVQGGLTFTAASSYMVEVSPTSAGRTNVMGTATLNGATLNASFVPGGYVARQYTILNATGGINGKFGAVVFNSPASITPSLSYDADNAYLNVAINFAVPGGLNQESAERRQRPDQFLQLNWRHPRDIRGADAGRIDASLRRNSHRYPADQHRCHDAIHGGDDRSVHRGPRQPRIVGVGICRAGRSLQRLWHDHHGAAAGAVRAALERVDRGVWRIADHRRQCRGRLLHSCQRNRWRRRRRRLLALAADGCRVCAGRRRHQLRRGGERQRAL